jgi:hypothetical protein
VRAWGLIVKRGPWGVSWKPWARSISRQDGSGADAILTSNARIAGSRSSS